MRKELDKNESEKDCFARWGSACDRSHHQQPGCAFNAAVGIGNFGDLECALCVSSGGAKAVAWNMGKGIAIVGNRIDRKVSFVSVLQPERVEAGEAKKG